MASGAGQGLRPVTIAADDWSAELAPLLFAPPARWGWQAVAPVPIEVVAPPPLQSRPVWVEPPRPDTTAQRALRSKAVSRVVWRLAFTVVAAFAFTTYQLVIEAQVGEYGSSAHQVYQVVLIVLAGLLALSVLRAIAGVRFANRNIRNFEQPYLTLRAAEQDRHGQALRQWDETQRRHAANSAAAARAAAEAAKGPQWLPVYPASEPTRVDVFGGDPRRHGWASLLVTFGASLLAAGHRITVLDLTGQEVGDNLVKVARAVGRPTTTVRLDAAAPPDVHLLGGLGARDIAECLGHALTGRPDGDRREERALATELLRRVLGSLDGEVTFARLAAGMRVLRQGTGDGQLSDDEVNQLAAHIGDVDQTEWTTRQLRFLASQLDLLHELAPAGHGDPLWTNAAVNLVATPSTITAANTVTDTIHAGAVAATMNVELVKNFRLIATGFYGSGGGRYIGSTAGPDLIIRPDGNMSPVHSGSGIGGFDRSRRGRGGSVRESGWSACLARRRWWRLYSRPLVRLL